MTRPNQRPTRQAQLRKVAEALVRYRRTHGEDPRPAHLARVTGVRAELIQSAWLAIEETARSIQGLPNALSD